MDVLPKDKILQFHPNTVQHIRKLYNLDKPGQVEEAVDLLDDWIKKQNHLIKKDYSREYLERSIILLKGSVERAKMQIEKLCTIRTLIPNFFEKTNAKNDFNELKDHYGQSLLPKLTNDHHRVHIASVYRDGLNAKLFLQFYMLSVFFCEYIKAHDYCDGIVSVLDLRAVDVTDYVSAVNFMDLRQIVTIGMEGYCMRVKGIHILTPSTAIDLLVKIFKQMFSVKISNRIHVHKTIETLYDFIPKDTLPMEWGGNEKSLSVLNDEWLEVLSTEENVAYMKEMNAARTQESLRTTFKLNEEYLGVTGSFRCLNVD